MSTDFNYKLLTAKEVKKFDLLEYVYPDEEDQRQPFWDKDGKIHITNQEQVTYSYDPKSGEIILHDDDNHD